MRRLITVLACSLLLFGCADNGSNAMKSTDKSLKVELVDNSDIPPVYRVVNGMPTKIEDDVVLIEVQKPLSGDELFYMVFGEFAIIVLMIGGYILFLRWLQKKIEDNV